MIKAVKLDRSSFDWLRTNGFFYFKALLVFACALLIALPVQAATTPEGEGTPMEEVVVTATRDKQEVRKVPANVTVITAEQIANSGATSIPELLNSAEGVHFRTFSGNPSQAQVDIRGFGGDNPFGKTLVLLDGRRLNRPDMSSINWLEVPLSDVERIEIIRGPHSVLYGDAAVGGTINIITKKGKGKPKFDASFIAGSYGLYDTRAGLSGSAGKLTYSLNGENQVYSGYRDRSAFSTQGGGFNIGYDFSEYFDASLATVANRTKFQMPGALTKVELEQNRKQFQPGHASDEAENNYFNTNLLMRGHLGSYGRIESNFIFGRRDLTSDMPSFPSFFNSRLDSYGVTPKYILDKGVFDKQNKLVVGTDLYHETLDTDRYSSLARVSKTSFSELKKETFGIYIRDEFQVLRDLLLSAGYRTERARIQGTETQVSPPLLAYDKEKIHHAEAYEVGLTYMIGEQSKVYAKYSTVYRFPFLDEQASYYGFFFAPPFGDTFLVDLESEKGKSYEAGTEIFPIKNLRIKLAVFRTDLQDEISYDMALMRNVNLDETRHEGFEAAVAYTLKDLARINANFTYNNAVFRKGPFDGNQVPLVPRQLANIILELMLPYKFTLQPEMHYVGKSCLSSDYANSAEKLSDYTLYNVYLFYRPEPKRIKWTAFFGVENVTDEKYSTIGIKNVFGGPDAFYPSPGITVKGGASISF